MINRFISDLKKYSKYIAYATKSQLKTEVTGSYLSWIWLFLNPICFMLIYTFIAIIVFKSKIEYFPVFVFIGITTWNFFQGTVSSAVSLVRANRDTVIKVYVPKFVLLITKMSVNTVKFLISFSLVIICMAIYQIPLSWNVLYFIPIYMGLYLITFGVASIFMHFGVFVEDLKNLVPIVLRMLFYMSGVFFPIAERVPAPYNKILLDERNIHKILLDYNPIAAVIAFFRDSLLYQTTPNLLLLSIWIILGVVLSLIGIKTIYKYENTYVKVMK